jgi:hypothetical protein
MEANKEYIKDRVISALYSESAGEYTLPDYNGDVKKILFSSASVIPSGKFPDGDSIGFSGVVQYSIVYLDGENNITHCDFTTDYDLAVKCNGESFVDADIDTCIQNTSLRLTGPRKFAAKCGLESCVHISEHCELDLSYETENRGEPEMLTRDVMIRSCVSERSPEREYAEELERLDGVIADEAEVLFCGCDIIGESISFDEAGGVHKGEMRVYALIKVADEVPHNAEKIIPFETRFFENGCHFESVESCIPGAELYVTSLKCSVNPDEDGVSVTVSLITEGKMRIDYNTPLTLVKDMYLTDWESETCESELGYEQLISSAVTGACVTADVKREDVSAEFIRNVILTDARARVTDTECLDTSIKVSGEIRFSGIACEINEDGALAYTGIKVDVPFSENVNINCQIPESAKVNATAIAGKSRIEADSTSLSLSSDIKIAVSVAADRREKYVSSCHLTGEKYEDDDTVVTVYYPEEGETLFDIAKKYHKSVVSVASVNAITESVFRDRESSAVTLGINKLVIR